MCIYNFKFFLWETGYFNSMDIQHDRAGYYICWGCLVWVPAVGRCRLTVSRSALKAPMVSALEAKT